MQPADSRSRSGYPVRVWAVAENDLTDDGSPETRVERNSAAARRAPLGRQSARGIAAGARLGIEGMSTLPAFDHVADRLARCMSDLADLMHEIEFDGGHP